MLLWCVLLRCVLLRCVLLRRMLLRCVLLLHSGGKSRRGELFFEFFKIFFQFFQLVYVWVKPLSLIHI